MSDNPSETDVAALAEQIDARPWSVEGYAFEGGSEESFTVTLKVEWVGHAADVLVDETETRDLIHNIRAIVNDLEDEFAHGAPVSEILSRAEDEGLTRDAAEHELDKLRRQGDVYEPTEDHLRVV